MKKILSNCITAGNISIPAERSEILNDTEKIRTKLLSLLEEAKLKENVDIFLSYYYIHYKKKLFIKFINNEKYKNEILTDLNLNRNLFKNFTNDIINPELIQEAINGTELLSLMKLYPNIVECFKILTQYEIYLKFIAFKQMERKAINIMIIQTPQKTDDIDLLSVYFKIIFDYFIEEQIYPLVIKEDFFFQYYKLFEEDEENFHQLILIIEMLNLYNIYNKQKINSDELLKSFYEKGLSLIKNKKLKNLDFILFIKSVQNLNKENQQFLEYFPEGIDFNENNKEFLNQILNSDSFKLKDYLGDSYNTIIEKIFEKFVAPKDLLALRKWDLRENTPKIMVEIFLKTIQRIWVKYPENNMYGLENLFAKNLL